MPETKCCFAAVKFGTRSVNALVLAGGINRILLFDGYTPGYKALLPFRGKPLIQYTIDTLNNTPEVNRICIAGPDGSLRKAIKGHGELEFAGNGETLIQNIHQGLLYFRDSPIVLIIPSDLPLVTPLMISDFFARASKAEASYRANVLWSMVPEEDFRGFYVNVKKGFNRFREVSVCHGNLLLVTPSLAENDRFRKRMESIYKARKSSVKAALAVGPMVGLSYLVGVHLLRLMSLSRFAAIASAEFGVGLVPVIMHFPEIAVDIDEQSDYEFIIEELGRRRET